MSELRRIAPFPIITLTPNTDVGTEPGVMWVNPTDLYVEESYQRNLSRKSATLIKKIIEGFSWAKYKPPVCVKVQENKYLVVDGQHTAIAAASHPSINQILIMIISADSLKDRAESFMGHNVNRIAVTPSQLHQASLIAQDEKALAIQKVCDAAGVRLIKAIPPNGKVNFGETIALGSIRKLIKDRGPDKAVVVLQALVKAGNFPVSSTAIKGVDSLLYSEEYHQYHKAEDITSVLRNIGVDLEFQAAIYSKERNIPEWQGFAKVLFAEVTKHVKQHIKSN